MPDSWRLVVRETGDQMVVVEVMDENSEPQARAVLLALDDQCVLRTFGPWHSDAQFNVPELDRNS